MSNLDKNKKIKLKFYNSKIKINLAFNRDNN